MKAFHPRLFGLELLLLWLFLLLAYSGSAATTILQSSGSTAIAWEAEKYGTYLNDPLAVTTPSPIEYWTPTNDAAASGGQTLYTVGANNTAFPVSYVDYQLQFATPGTYRLYDRARADVAFAAGDRFTANSFWLPRGFNTGFATNATDAIAIYIQSASNGSDAQANPSSTNFVVYGETIAYEVTQAMVDNREVVTLRIGTRERGMIIDRFVLSTDQALTEAGFNALPNSDVDIFVQGAGATHIAFEAETPKGKYLNDPLAVTTPSPIEYWTPTNDAAASGGQTLYTVGANNTAFPVSYVDYQLQFATPGTYRLYDRARADVAFAAGDRFTANSFWLPRGFNTGFATNATDAIAIYIQSASNGSDAQANPSSTNFVVYGETIAYEVTQAMVDNREVVTLRIGTRERGMIIDRFVLSTDQALTEAGFNALPNTALDNKPPQVVSVTPSITFTNVSINFDEAISPGSLDFFSFEISGGVSVLGLSLDTATLRKLTIHCSPQTPGATYTITFSGVADVSGNAVPDNSQVTFEAWRLQTGWATREIYSGIAGGAVSDLEASPKYPDNADSLDSSAGVSMLNNPRANNYGMRVRFFFVPPVTDQYDFYVYADDQAEVSISPDEDQANLVPVVTTSAPSSAYDPNVKGTLAFQDFVAGQRYLVQVLFKQSSGDARLGVAVATQSAGAAAAPGLPPLTELRGNVIATYINPATASVNITAQPQNTSVTVGHSARFSAAATSPAGAPAYQWQVDGVDIPGANRPVYVTPALSFADGSKRYRVMVGAGGATAVSAEAGVTINAGQPPTALPYVGINFIGGGGAIEGFVSSTDIAGVVPQANFNNVDGGTQTAAPLNDASGNTSPVTVSYSGDIRYTGTGTRTADDALFEGYIRNVTAQYTAPMTVTLGGVPPGNYGLLAYCVGFDFQSIYDQSYELVGSATYPVLHVRGETAGDYRASPGYRRMSSTNPNARDSGNYVMFENVSPDSSGAFMLTVTFESSVTPGVTDAMPVINAMQLVRIVPPLPVLSVTYNGNGTVTVSWGANATGYRLKSTGSLGPSPAPVWNTVGGSPNPIAVPGSVTVNSTDNQFFRLEK